MSSDNPWTAARKTDDASKLSNKLKDCRLLPPNFEPLPYSVIIGRGNITKSSVGNRRLDVIASSFLSRYSEATSKAMKTKIVSEVVATIRNACPYGGAFIRYAHGRWWEVDDSAAREKVGYCFRNLLHDKYSTSAKSKTARRKERKEKRLSVASAATESSDDYTSSVDRSSAELSRSTTTASMASSTVNEKVPSQYQQLFFPYTGGSDEVHHAVASPGTLEISPKALSNRLVPPIRHEKPAPNFPGVDPGASNQPGASTPGKNNNRGTGLSHDDFSLKWSGSSSGLEDNDLNSF